MRFHFLGKTQILFEVLAFLRFDFPFAICTKTEKYLWDTKISHYLGQKHDRNAKKLKFYEFLDLTSPVQKFST